MLPEWLWLNRMIYALFFLSGFPALIYQIVWQRALFTIYGVNIESVTVVVSAFMLGLGLGSLLGGWISKCEGAPLLAIFGLVELGTAGFGLISLRLFHLVAFYTAGVSVLKTGLFAFTLVLIPTILMGSTLPLLLAHVVRRSGNVGRSVGILYSVNTLGSAVACYATGKVLMRTLGESGSVAFAAAINASVGIIVLVLYLLSRKPEPAVAERQATRLEHSNGNTEGLLAFPVAMLVGGLSGFIALGYEIVWYRLYSFTSGGEAKSFAYLLGAYLAGIALGSLFARRVCAELEGDIRKYVRLISLFAISANFFGFLVAPVLAFAVRHILYTHTLPLICITTAFLGAIFPLVCHVSMRPDRRAGESLSYLYLSNIIGSTLGSLTVGFLLMNIRPLRYVSVLLALMGLFLGTALLVSAGLKTRRLVMVLSTSIAIAVLITLAARPLFDKFYEQLQLKGTYRPNMRFAHIVETRSGIVTVSQDGTFFGGGVYDGRSNTDLVHDTNGIVRAYALSSFHPRPRQVLMIGLSSGSWAQVIVNHPQLERLTVVEINPGYLQLIPKYPAVASLQNNPKLQLVIDDGRRWLVRNRGRKFDVIVSNTTYHWRAHNTNLLSVEFLRLIRQHLNRGGIFYYNTTSSADALLTGATVFPYAMRVMNFLAVSDTPIEVNKERWKRTLLAYKINGKPILDLERREHQNRLVEVLSMAEGTGRNLMKEENADSLRQHYGHLRVITDDNMGLEWER